MTIRPGHGDPAPPFAANGDHAGGDHQRSISLDHCEHGWARVVVVLPADFDVGLTLLAAADALGGAVLGALASDGETMPDVGFGASASAVQARPPTRDSLDSFGSLN